MTTTKTNVPNSEIVIVTTDYTFKGERRISTMFVIGDHTFSTMVEADYFEEFGAYLAK